MGKEERRPQQRRTPGAAWVARSRSATRQAPTRSNGSPPVRERRRMERECAERGGDGRVMHTPWPHSPPLAQQINTDVTPMAHTVPMQYSIAPAGTPRHSKSTRDANQDRYVREILLRARVHVIDANNVVPRLEGVHHGHGGGLATRKRKTVCAPHTNTAPEPTAATRNGTGTEKEPAIPSVLTRRASVTAQRGHNQKMHKKTKHTNRKQSRWGTTQSHTGGHPTHASHPQGTPGTSQSHPGSGCSAGCTCGPS